MTGMTAIVTDYKVENGAIVSIKTGHALDYALMRANQLNALFTVMQAPGFSQCSANAQNDYVWLASTLAQEMPRLLEAVAADATQHLGDAA